MARERAELVGKVIDGRYLVNRTLAVGGTGVVFDVEQLDTGDELVLKAMRPVYAQNADLQRRLRREAEISRVVRHRGIVPVVDEGVLGDGSPYIVMEKIPGISLSRLLLRVGHLESSEAALIGIRVASILHAAHAEGYVHRDIKP
ncbi:MAG: protein kinase, partial [Myxococcales bacterium]|nr:protein kinase [Myxococcales bacterium]